MPKNRIDFLTAGLLAILTAGSLPTPCLAGDAAPGGRAIHAAAVCVAFARRRGPRPRAVGRPGAEPAARRRGADHGAAADGRPARRRLPAPRMRPSPVKPSPKAEASTGETVDLAQRPFAYIEGKADRDEVYGAIQGSLGLVKRDIDKAGLKPAGRPIARVHRVGRHRLPLSRRLPAREPRPRARRTCRKP